MIACMCGFVEEVVSGVNVRIANTCVMPTSNQGNDCVVLQRGETALMMTTNQAVVDLFLKRNAL